MAEFKQYLEKLQTRLSFIEEFYKEKHLEFTFDTLDNSISADHELLYIAQPNKEEQSGVFVFGSQFYICDASEQEFKSKLSLNSLNFKILRAYKRLKKKQDKVKISDILQEIQDKKKDSSEVDVILRRILTLAYYLNWDMKRDEEDIEGDSLITIPDVFMQRLKQRFNFDVVCSIYEDEEVFMFLNTRAKLNLVFKDKEEFTKRDIERVITKVFTTVFESEECHFQ